MRLLRLPRSLAEINNDCIILGSWETEPLAHAFADYSVYFVCLHARDNSRRRLSFSRSATFLMQLAPFLLYKSHCGASRALYTYKDASCMLAAVPCTRVPIKDASL